MAEFIGGAVTIGPLTFVACELSIAGEIALGNRLRAMAKRALGPGSFWAEALPVIDWLKKQERPAEASAQQRITAELVATKAGVSDDCMTEFRQSAAGVVEELFARTRKTHPEATLDEIRACVNDANALEVHLAICDAISPKKD